jgi:hypothetical protein
MYALYYASLPWCWQLERILVRTTHPCLTVGHHIIFIIAATCWLPDQGHDHHYCHFAPS